MQKGTELKEDGREAQKHSYLTYLLLINGLTISGRGRLTDHWALVCLVSSRAQVGLYVHDTASLFSSGFHTPGYAHGPPHTWAVSGSHAVSRLSSWAGFKMFPVHFSMTHSGCVADPNVATILFVSLAEQLDCSSLLFRFSRWMSDFAILHSQNSCINTARPEVSLKNLPR